MEIILEATDITEATIMENCNYDDGCSWYSSYNCDCDSDYCIRDYY